MMIRQQPEGHDTFALGDSCFCAAKVAPMAISVITASVNWLSDKRYLCVRINHQIGPLSRTEQKSLWPQAVFRKTWPYRIIFTSLGRGATRQIRICATKKALSEDSALYSMAGVAGLEPTNAGFRIQCLTNLAIPLSIHALWTKNIIWHLPISVKKNLFYFLDIRQLPIYRLFSHRF